MIRSIGTCIDSCANLTAPSISASDSSYASDSTIITASFVPATTRSRRCSGLFLSSCMSSHSGFRMYSPSTKPTRAAPIGPMKGAPEIVRAADVAISATMSGSLTRSCDRTVQITRTSFLKPGANSGRIGRSIRRLVSVSFSVGRASRLKKPPGTLPAA